MELNVDGNGYSSSSCSTRRWKFHVFLSFRGEDTRKGFADHLYAALQRKGIITFRDNDELERGQVIKKSLLQAIEESFSAIVILSQNYAFSTWCLDELLKILDCKKEVGLQVFPIFYGVDPSDVRYQRGSFAEAFRKQEEKFTKEKVQKWRDALNKVANFSGWHSENWHEAEFIEHITEAVWSKLQSKLRPDFDFVVGIESRIEVMDSLIAKELDDVRFIGIWGMGGIGKTTLARVVFERIKDDFEFSCFLADVRGVCEREGLVQLQRKVLSHLKTRSLEIDDIYQGRKLIRNFLCNKKILVVLDDVSNLNQLENLVGMQEWFGLGSRVIITTRDVHLLKSHGVSAMYEMKILDNDNSLKLFYQKAFKGNQPKEGYLDLSRTIVGYAKGLPLTLKVLGSFLCEKTKLEWEDAFNMLRKIPPKDVLIILKLSYDELEENEKTIFLNIACFFNGMAKDEVTEVLESCGLFAKIGIKILADKSLVAIDSNGDLLMHDMLQEMGKNIVLQESPDDPGRRSRLWSCKDINNVLGEKKGTKEIQWIGLKLLEPHEAYWDREAFSCLSNLRLLIISGDLNLRCGFKSFPRALKVLQWDKYKFDALPHGTPLDKLVHFRMRQSKIKQLCKETQFMGNLKFMDLSHCIDLTKLPNFDGIPNLERLVLEGCKSLVEIHHSLGQHKKLMIVNLKDCKSLKALPRKLEMNSLETFILSGCSKIRRLPDFGETMELLSTLDLEETSIIRLPESLSFLIGLTTLNLRNCKNLVCLPNVIQNLRSIKIINLSGCSKCEKLSENWNENKAMEELDLSETAIKEIPSSIFLLENLKFLSFRGCKGTSPRQAWNFPIPFGWKHKLNNPSISTMLTLPSSLPSQPSLKKLDLSYCNLSDESLPKDLSNLSSLESLILKGNNFVNLPATLISNLFRLRFLSLKHCPRLQSLPQLPPNITIIRANDCASMKALLDSQLLGLIASLNSQFRMETNSIEDYFFLMIQGSEIPSWFHNENYIYVTCPKEETNLSFIADVPDYCCSSEWWGIVVCLVIHDDIASTPSSANVILFKCYPIEDEPPLKYRLGQELDPQYNSAHQLLIFFIPCYYNFHVKKLQLEFFIDSDSELQPKITKYSWCVLCKEDIEAWLQTKCEGSSINRRSENVIDIASNHIDCLNEIRVATEAAQQNQQCHEIDVKDAATTDAKQNKENSKH